jgi:hypothetical protein
VGKPTSGRTLSIEFIVVLLMSGQTVGHIAAFMRDVTARRNQELELRGRITELEGGSSLSGQPVRRVG